jgi:hypothetical protein
LLLPAFPLAPAPKPNAPVALLLPKVKLPLVVAGAPPPDPKVKPPPPAAVLPDDALALFAEFPAPKLNPPGLLLLLLPEAPKENPPCIGRCYKIIFLEVALDEQFEAIFTVNFYP